MSTFHRRYRKLACCHLCEKRLGAPRLYKRMTKAKIRRGAATDLEPRQEET